VYCQALHDAATPSTRTAEAEEPRGEEDAAQAQHVGSPNAGTAPTAPSIQATCPDSFGNSDIYGGGWLDSGQPTAP
jgi:hypothetical protein